MAHYLKPPANSTRQNQSAVIADPGVSDVKLMVTPGTGAGAGEAHSTCVRPNSLIPTLGVIYVFITVNFLEF